MEPYCNPDDKHCFLDTLGHRLRRRNAVRAWAGDTKTGRFPIIGKLVMGDRDARRNVPQNRPRDCALIFDLR